MTLCPFATWRGSPNVGGAAERPARGLVVHVEVGTEAGTDACFRSPTFGASSHFGCAVGGGLDQWVDTDQVAWAEVSGNPGWISVETEGTPDEPLTAAQVEALGALAAWLRGLYGFPLQTCDHDGTGITTHAHYPSGDPDPAWGGHPCPGALRTAQLPAILAAAGGANTDEEELFPMAIFRNDDDARRWFVRRLFNDELGREPSAGEQTNWAGYLAANGADLTLAAIRDAPEAADWRKAHQGLSA